MRVFIISALFVLSGILGFFCQMLYANYFGSGKEMDIYFSLISIPAIIIGATGTIFSSLFFPAFARIQQLNLDEYIFRVKSYVSKIAIVIAIIGFTITFFNIRNIIDTDEPSYFNLALVLSALFWLNAYMSIINGYLGSVQNYFKNFVIVSSCSLIVYICIIVFVLLFHDILGVKSMGAGLVLASIFSYIINRYYGGIFHKSHAKVNIDSKKLLTNVCLIIISFLPFHAFASISYLWAGQLEYDGSVSLLGYSHSFCAFLSSVASMGIATVSFPDLARSLSSTDTNVLHKGYLNFRNQLEVVVIFASYVAIFAIFLAHPLIEILFMRGKFDLNTVDSLSLVLPIYLVDGVFAAIMSMTRNVYYSLNKQKIFALISGVVTLVFIISSFLLTTNVDYVVVGVVETISMGMFVLFSLGYLNKISHIFDYKYIWGVLVQLVLLVSIGWLMYFLYQQMVANNVSIISSIVICGLIYSLFTDFLLCTLVKSPIVLAINKKIVSLFK